MTCAEIMTPEPKMCVPEGNVSIAIDIMWDCDCGAVPVVQDVEAKKLVGIITDRDIAMHIVKHAYAHPSEVKIADCMSLPAVYVNLEESVEEAIEIMGENQIRRVPVVDENQTCVGIISQADLFSRLTGTEAIEAVYKILEQISDPSGAEKQVTTEPAIEEAPPEKKEEEDKV